MADRGLGELPPDSILEVAFERLVARHGLPQAEYQYEIRSVDGTFLARVDFAYPRLRIAIEVDGFAVHGTPSAMSADFARQNPLIIAGWLVLRFTWVQVQREPAWVAEQIAAALESRR